MTLRMIEGWDYLPATPSNALLGATGWTGSLNPVRTTTNTAFGSGRSMSWDSPGNFNQLYKFLRGQWTTPYVFGIRMNVPTTGIGQNDGRDGVYSIRGADTTSSIDRQWELNFDQFGTIFFIRVNGTTRTVAAKTLPGVFVPGNWFYLEVKITPGYTDGTLEIKVNTVPVLSLINVRTANGTPVLPATQPGITHLWWSYNPLDAAGSWSNDWRSDDCYFLTMDGSQNNDYLGNVRVRYMPVIGNSTPLDWIIGGTSPAPTNWQSVLNLSVNDTSFVRSSTVGAEDFYDIDPILNVPTVFGVEIGGAYRQDDATQRFVANQIRSAGVTATGTTLATNQSYTFSYDIYELNPATGLGWSGAEVNAIDVGPKVIG